MQQIKNKKNQDRLVQLECIVVFLMSEFDRKHKALIDKTEGYKIDPTYMATEQEIEEKTIENRLESLLWILYWLYKNFFKKEDASLQLDGIEKRHVENSLERFKRSTIGDRLSSLENVVFIIWEDYLKNAHEDEKEVCLNCSEFCSLLHIVDSFLNAKRRVSR